MTPAVSGNAHEHKTGVFHHQLLIERRETWRLRPGPPPLYVVENLQFVFKISILSRLPSSQRTVLDVFRTILPGETYSRNHRLHANGVLTHATVLGQRIFRCDLGKTSLDRWWSVVRPLNVVPAWGRWQRNKRKRTVD
jgi:hypothetical protein